MRTEIIEILQKAYPEYCLKHIDTANEILRLFSVVGRSEQLLCSCDNPNGFKEMDEGKEFCSQCQKPY